MFGGLLFERFELDCRSECRLLFFGRLGFVNRFCDRFDILFGLRLGLCCRFGFISWLCNGFGRYMMFYCLDSYGAH